MQLLATAQRSSQHARLQTAAGLLCSFVEVRIVYDVKNATVAMWKHASMSKHSIHPESL